jgi:hypothetical protein
MRKLLIASMLALAPFSAAIAQEVRGPQVIYVGPEPDFRLSIGAAQGGADERVTIRARQELAADCTWVAASDVTVPMDEIVTLRDPQLSAVPNATAFSTQRPTAHWSLTRRLPSPDYHGCVRQQMTQRAGAVAIGWASTMGRGDLAIVAVVSFGLNWLVRRQTELR